MGWKKSSPKDTHIALLPYQRWAGPTSFTFAPRHQPGQEFSIDHLTIWDPRRITRQIEDTGTVQTAFLDHLGVMGTQTSPSRPWRSCTLHQRDPIGSLFSNTPSQSSFSKDGKPG